MSVAQYNKGSAIVVEVEFKKYTAFGEYVYFDPSTYTITVTDTEGSIKVDAENLIKHEAGKYYYVIPTATDWITGRYETKISSSDSGNNDITIDPRSFFLE